METVRRLLNGLASAGAFFVLVGLGIAAGAALSLGEAIDEQLLAPKKRISQTDTRDD